MKRNVLFIMAIAAMFTTLTSCEKNNQVVANYDSIVLAPGESVQVEISGGSASINVDQTKWGHTSDSIFTITDFKRHSVRITGNNVGQDTLRLSYNREIYANGEHLSIPVCVKK